MVSPGFLKLSSATAHAQNAIYQKHLANGAPRETVRDSLTCPRCKGPVSYVVSVTAKVNGRCTSPGCIKVEM